MALKVIKERCTGCGLCVQVCPYNAIKLSDEN
ncbi:MAG: 4Fe-4S binding protein, partial [Synergistales bacterium]|nr:4Fe-4S binding protein [Synergistales bacterium]